MIQQMNPSAVCGFILLVLALPASVPAADNPSLQNRSYKLDGAIWRQVLENYLARSISMEGVFNGRGDFSDNVRMLTNTGAKYIGRSLCLWGAEANFLRNVERAKNLVPLMQAADPEMILEACVFETVSPRVDQITIPPWV